MKIEFDVQTFGYLSGDDIVLGVYLLNEQEDPFEERIPLEFFFDNEFDMNEIPGTQIMSLDGKYIIEEMISNFRELADKAEKRLATYEFKEE